MTTPISLSALRSAIANRGDIGGPMTTFPSAESDLAHVTIICSRANCADVVRYLSEVERALPVLVEVAQATREYERARPFSDDQKLRMRAMELAVLKVRS